MSRFAVGVVQTVFLAGAALVVQQLIAAGVYGVLAYPFGSPLRVSWFDYVEEYLLWRIRMPGHGMTQTQIVANALGLVTVVVGGVLLYQVIYG